MPSGNSGSKNCGHWRLAVCGKAKKSMAIDVFAFGTGFLRRPGGTRAALLCGALLATLPSLRAADFPTPYNSERDTNAAPLTPAAALAQIQLPPGFRATVFAAEPAVQNPIACAGDSRGRLWVAENYTYAERPLGFESRLQDRVLIFEDRHGDGTFSSRKVFTEDVQRLTSIEVGHGGVWLMCPPRLLFLADRDGDDVPDGVPEVILDGFTPPADGHHTFANGLRFGPDGWLYGRCGASSPGEIGIPGAPANARIPVRGTLWRYHPQTRVVESLSSGTTNPWGHDWNSEGELFFINTVNGHLWHQIQGAHYVRPHTIDPNPHVYALIDQHADHWHFDTGKGWSQSRDGQANSFGGGHAHVGMMIYQGANWPAEYRDRLFTLNFHGRRINQEILERSGTGYVGKHGTDLLLAGDPWFRGMELTTGPDGGVFVLDWSDTGECHESTGVHRTSGRIYKITHGNPERPAIEEVARLSTRGLADLQTHTNNWLAHQARLELSARAATGLDLSEAVVPLREHLQHATRVDWSLRALWSLYVMGAADPALLEALLENPDEHLRVWAIRLLTDRWPLDTVLSERPRGAPKSVEPHLLDLLVRRAQMDSSGLVRLTLASVLQRLPTSARVGLASALAARAEDATDHNQPQMVWYGLIPLADQDLGGLPPIARECRLPLTLQCIARRLAEASEKNPTPLNELLRLATEKPETYRRSVVTGMAEALAGWRKTAKPVAWDALAETLTTSSDAGLREKARELSVVFGDGRALDAVRQIALDPHAGLDMRKSALQSLIDARPPDLSALCESLLTERFLNAVAVRGLAASENPGVGRKLVKAWSSFHPSERPQLLATLVTRSVFARALLDAIAKSEIPRAELSVADATRIRAFDDPPLRQQLAEVWGEVHDTPADKQRLIARLRMDLTSTPGTLADAPRGRALFQATCATCHKLFGQGADIGPDLTGAHRDNLDYLLENIVDPGAVVSADFRTSEITLKDGRTLQGVTRSTTERTLTLQTPTGLLHLERQEIERIHSSPHSLMPDGLLDTLSAPEIRQLMAYLMSPQQVSLPAPR